MEWNRSAVDAISERVAQVTALAEELDAALTGGHRAAGLSDILDSSPHQRSPPQEIALGIQEWYGSLEKRSSPLKEESSRSEEEFATASECTCTPPSRSSSYHTASEGEAPHWYQSSPQQEVVTSEVTQEVTETKSIKLSREGCSITTEVMTSEIRRDKGGGKEVVCSRNIPKGSSLVEGRVSPRGGACPGEDAAPAPAPPPGPLPDRPRSASPPLPDPQVKDWLELRVLEVSPGLTLLGDSLEEAALLRDSHYDVIQKVQSKKSPVEELLRQADDAVEREGGGVEKERVYGAMGESLTAAWDRVQGHLDTRRRILDLNLDYHRCAEEFEEACEALEQTCASELPIEIEELQESLARVAALERRVLHSVGQALRHGSALLDILSTIKEEGTLDSRPGQIKLQAELSKCQVERWMEGLGEKRGNVMRRAEETRARLEGCLSLAIITADLTRLHRLLEERTESLLRSSDQLGDAHASAQLLLHEHRKLTPEGKELQEQALKIVKATEEFAGEGHFAGPEAIAQAYQLLDLAATYLHHIDHRESNLIRSIDFFNNAQSALIKLDQLEVQLTTGDLGLNYTQLEQLHANIAKSLEEVTSSPLQEGYSLLQDVPGAEGVKRMVEQIENKKINLSVQCTAHKEENIKANRVYNNFIEKYEQLNAWLTNMDAYLTGMQDMGNNLAMANDFLQMHRKNLNDLEVKGNEITALVNSIPSIVETLSDQRRTDVEEKGERLRSLWRDLRARLEERVTVGGAYARALELAARLNSELDSLEASMRDPGTIGDEDKARAASASASQILPQFTNIVNNFIHDSQKGGCGGGAEVERARARLESELERLAARHAALNHTVSTWLTDRENSRAAWNTNMAATTKTVDWVGKLDAQLYPVLSEEAHSARQLACQVEHRQNTVLPEIRRAHQEIQLRIQTAEALVSKGGVQAFSEGVPVRLRELNSRLQTISTDYQILLEKMLTFFNGLSQVESRVEAIEREEGVSSTALTPQEATRNLQEFEATRLTLTEMINLSIIESGHLIARIRSQEAESERDVRQVERVVERVRGEWEGLAGKRARRLAEEARRLAFSRDLQEILSSLHGLATRLHSYTTYGESLPEARATSRAFTAFEITIKELEERIERFMRGAREEVGEEAEKELEGLKKKWEALKQQVIQARKTIDLTIEYFTLVEEAEEWFREGNRLIMIIARRSSHVKTIEEASKLLKEIEDFVKPGEEKQFERINKITLLAQQMQSRGSFPQVTQVKSDSREMIESFNQVSSDLKALCEELKKPPEPAVEPMETDVGVHKTHYIIDEQHIHERKEFVTTEVIHKIEVQREEAKAVSPKPVEDSVQKEEEQRVQKSPSPPAKKIRYQEEAPPAKQPYFTLTLRDATVQEGSKFTFNCRVTGLPAPEIVWEKDGMGIENNPDYQTKFNDGLCSLTIEETFAEDSAVFTCTASNAAGCAQTAATLTVKESEPEISPPIFITPVTGGSIEEGGKMKLRCVVDGLPLPTVQWATGEGLSLDSDPRYTILFNNGEASIEKLSPASPEDQGVYSCTASNPHGSQTSMAKVTIIKKPEPEGEEPKFTVEVGNVMARTGQKIKLECQATGKPLPEFTWTKDGQPLKQTHDIKVTSEDSRSTLVINEAFPKDAGTYAVRATNSSGSKECVGEVTVKGLPPPEETSDSEQPSDMEPSRPAINLHLKDQSVFEGKKVRLDCIIVGHPEPEVIWYHKEKPVKESTDIQLTFQGDRCSLLIKEVLLEDAGSYKVVAINSAGEASSTCNLNVQAIDKSSEGVTREIVVEERIEEKTMEAGPRFTKMLTDLLVSQGDTVTLEVEVAGIPTPTVTWALNNNDLQQSGRIHMSQDSEGKANLKLSNIVPEDKGVYTAKASNQLGEAKCFSHLIVKAPAPSLPTASQPVENPAPQETKQPPAFTELFQDRAVPEGAAAKFECIVTGKPTPKVRWLFNDAPVSGKDFLVSTSGSRQVLTIPTVTKDHGGKITCSAENEAGKSACAAILSIEDGMDSMFDTMGGLSMQESKTGEVFEMKRQVFMQSSSSSKFSSSSTMVQGAGEPTVQMQSFSKKSEMASHKIGDSPVVQMEKHKTSEYSNIGGIESKSESEVVKSSGGDAESCTTKSVVSKPQRRNTPPRFISPLTGCIVDHGANVSLQAIIEGYPVPNVSWSKNGGACPPGADISWELGKASLKLSNMSTSESGRYTCTATNPAGTAASTADIVVKKSSFPPVMGKRLQGSQTGAGQRVCLEVEVTGTPAPTVVWSKDGQTISPSSQEFRLQSFGNSHSLIIDKAELSHSGQYSVLASNSAGEARSTAELIVLQDLPQPSTAILYQTTMENGKIQDLNFPKMPTFGTTFGPVKDSVIVSESYKSEKQVSMKVEHSSQKIDFGLKSFGENRVESERPLKIEEPTLIREPEVQKHEEFVEDSSITKKSALDFFKNIIKENEEEDRKSKAPEVSHGKPPEISHVRHVEPPSFTPTPKLEKSFQEFQSKSFSETFKTESIESAGPKFAEFHLEPGPPPEIGFAPKIGVTKTKEEMATRVKKVEESHRKLSETEAPPGGVKIFPTPSPVKEVLEKKSMFEHRKEVKEEVIIPQKIEPAGSMDWSHPFLRPAAHDTHVRPESPRPSADGVSMEKLWTSKQQHKEDLFQHVQEPLQQFDPRPLSPRPSAEGRAMDKIWAHKHSESSLKMSWPPPMPSTEDLQFEKTHKQSSQSVQESSFLKTSVQEVVQQKRTFEEKVDEKKLPPETKPGIYYVAEARATHSSNVMDRQQIISTSQKKESSSSSETQVVEENILLPSVAKQIWPPGLPVEVDIKPKSKPPPSVRSHSVQDLPFDDIKIEPGPPPEIGFATPPPKERRQSYVETIEQGLEKDLEKEPSRHLVGAVRTMPPPPKKEKSVEPVPMIKSEEIHTEFKRSTSVSESFKPCSQPKYSTMPRPSKFVKKSNWGSDYESDLETTKIKARWTPWDSDTEEPMYRKVQPPTGQPKRPHSALPEPTLPLDTPVYYTSKTTAVRQKSLTTEIHPPAFLQPKKPEPKLEPKKKTTLPDSGYMADTDEPQRFLKQTKQQIQSQSTKKSSFTKTVEKKELQSPKLISQPVLRPVRPVPFQPIDTAPHVDSLDSGLRKPKPLIDLKPGSPPKMDYAPPPAGYKETSSNLSFAESTQSSRRVVNMQQTTRVISFDQSKKVEEHKVTLPSKVVARGDAKWATDSESELEERLRPGEPPQFHYAPPPATHPAPPKPSVVVNKHMNEMSSTFKTKAQQFASEVMKDVKQNGEAPVLQMKKKKDEPQVYREESRLAEHGKKHIDPDTGLIYFKYDFGYEFGVVLPGEGGGKGGAKRCVGTGVREAEKEGSIEVPVIHETTKRPGPGGGGGGFKSVKWEPTSESEFSEGEEGRGRRLRGAPRISIPASPSPRSTSPSLPSLSPYTPLQHTAGGWASGTSSPCSYSQTPPVVNASLYSDLPKKAPQFITPLRDIAVVNGGTARFECIVQAEPAPNILWAKDGRLIQPSEEHQIHFRNGVCRLTIPSAYRYDAGIYSCTATNSMGTTDTTANLQVSGEERTFIKK